MTTTVAATPLQALDAEQTQRLSEGLVAFLEANTAPDGLFEPDIFCDLSLPQWRIQTDTADAIVLDARSDKRLGGSGQALPWNELAADLARDRGSSAVVLAGGLKPENVAGAIRTLGPDVVDASSGVESSPGIKDPWLMREFYAAATGQRAH